MGLAKVALLYKTEHLNFLLAFVLNLNFGAFYSTPNAKPKLLPILHRCLGLQIPWLAQQASLSMKNAWPNE